MSEDNKKAWCGFSGWQPVARHEDCINATYTAPLDLNDGAWGKIRKTISNAKHGEFYVFDADGNASISIGDTPEQLGTIQASEAIMIDGKIVTREDVRKLQSERDALAATVEALRKDKSDLLAYVNDAERWFNRHDPNGYVSPKREAAQQHLRDVRAEAVIDAVVSHETKYGNSQFGRHLREYAERVKAGEK